MEREFPIGDTLADGTYRVTEHLLGSGSRWLYLGTRTDNPAERYFLSVMWLAKLSPADLRREIEYEVPGVFGLAHVGHFDVRGDDKQRNIHQGQYCALVEKLPEGDGDWLPRMLTRPLGPGAAVELGMSVGRILQRAVQDKIFLVGVRPEYIWGRRKGAGIEATGLSARHRDFFAHVGGGCLVPSHLFKRHYVAPEVYAEREEREESLVFSLAIMIAEWTTGAYPFPDSLAGVDMSSQCQGRHAPLDVPSKLAELLSLCFKPEPAHRPSLAHFLKRLSLLRIS